MPRPRLALRLVLVLMTVLPLATPSLAVQPDEILADPALESRARALSRELRCMVCQNESIDDSNAPLARDLRVLVRERLTAGESDAQVRDFLVARYGEFVLLRPRLSAATALLWIAPFALLVAGALAIVLTLRRRHRRAEEPVLTADEENRLAALVAVEDPQQRRDGNITQS